MRWHWHWRYLLVIIPVVTTVVIMFLTVGDPLDATSATHLFTYLIGVTATLSLVTYPVIVHRPWRSPEGRNAIALFAVMAIYFDQTISSYWVGDYIDRDVMAVLGDGSVFILVCRQFSLILLAQLNQLPPIPQLPVRRKEAQE